MARKDCPRPPPHLTAAAAAQWRALAPLLAARGALHAGTIPLLTIYCTDAALVAAYDKTIAREGAVLKTKSGLSKPHPLARPRAQAASRMLQFGKRLGLFGAQAQDDPGKPARDANNPYADLGV